MVETVVKLKPQLQIIRVRNDDGDELTNERLRVEHEIDTFYDNMVSTAQTNTKDSVVAGDLALSHLKHGDQTQADAKFIAYGNFKLGSISFIDVDNPTFYYCRLLSQWTINTKTDIFYPG